MSGFVLLQGRELLVNYTEPGHMANVFCARCGSSLFGGTWPDGPEVSIRLGTLDTDPGAALATTRLPTRLVAHRL